MEAAGKVTKQPQDCNMSVPDLAVAPVSTACLPADPKTSSMTSASALVSGSVNNKEPDESSINQSGDQQDGKTLVPASRNQEDQSQSSKDMGCTVSTGTGSHENHDSTLNEYTNLLKKHLDVVETELRILKNSKR